jgi:hypothetical protein
VCAPLPPLCWLLVQKSLWKSSSESRVMEIMSPEYVVSPCYKDLINSSFHITQFRCMYLFVSLLSL